MSNNNKINTTRRKLKMMKKNKRQQQEEAANPSQPGSEEQEKQQASERQGPPSAQEIVRIIQEGHQARGQLLESVVNSLHKSTANPARKREIGNIAGVVAGLNDVAYNSLMDLLKIVQQVQELKAQLFMLSMHVRVIEAALVEKDVVSEKELEAGHQKIQEEVAKQQEEMMNKMAEQAKVKEKEEAEAPKCRACNNRKQSRCELTDNRVDDFIFDDNATSPDWCPKRLPPKEKKVEETEGTDDKE